MYQSFGLIGIQLPEKYKENFDVSSEGASTRAVNSVCIHRTWTFTDKYINLLKNERMFAVKCGPNTTLYHKFWQESKI
jgi:hypothetical protein